MAAMHAHATQIKMCGTFFALSNNTGFPVSGREYFTLLSGTRGPGSGPHARETDLFAGIG
jgi:N-acetyl-1-D-myo-inositol-2-amino-2-deoxy-alpha-D-glucopyranoside deacetylase